MAGWPKADVHRIEVPIEAMAAQMHLSHRWNAHLPWMVIWSASLARKPTTLMQPANTNFHTVVPYTKLAREGWLQLCLPSHSIRFWPIRTSISDSVQLGPRTLWGSGASDSEKTDVDRPDKVVPLGRKPPLEGTGAKVGGTGLSSNPCWKSPSSSMHTCEDMHRSSRPSLQCHPLPE